MVGIDESAPAPVEGEQGFSLFNTIRGELNHVPVQKEALHKDAVSPDLEGMESLNSLPDVSLSGTHGKWEDEDGVIRSGKRQQDLSFALLSPRFYTPTTFIPIVYHS